MHAVHYHRAKFKQVPCINQESRHYQTTHSFQKKGDSQSIMALHLTSNDFQRQEDNDGQPVKHVVHSGPRKSSPEVADIRDLTNRDQRVCDRCSNVSTHNDRNGSLDVQNWKKGPAGMMLYHKGGTCMLADVISIACFQLLWCSGTIKCFIESVLNLLSAATMLTTMEVLVDELWTRTVERTPIITPQIGLLRSSLLRNTSPAALPKQGVETLLRMVFLYCGVNI